ncbi:major facilitator superfamily domain-containing protein [Phaeosphaeriaceae sp. PMI808]|nr:major facilitator superfamily domain-containing protein [Phaeosphaeriaceae sp. PMI808]
MSYLFVHSPVGTLIRYATKGNVDFSRRTEDDISTSLPTDNIPSAHTNLSSNTLPVTYADLSSDTLPVSYTELSTFTLPVNYTDLSSVTLPVAYTDVVHNSEHKTRQTNLVDWNGPNDPSNPQNWPVSHKVIMTAITCLYTFAVYVGSSIYTSSQDEIQKTFGVSHVEGSLGIALYVLGYGIGCLLFSPLSEMRAIGRNPPYAISGFLFVILCIPTALVENYAGLMVLRFLLGFMASPCLATVGASLTDIWSPPFVPFTIALWAAMATLGPAFGPTLSTYAVRDLGWRFSSWELMIIATPFYLMMLFLMPESSGSTILYYKAKRLREVTGNQKLMTQSELMQKDTRVSSLLFDAFVKPWEINALDPAILFTTLYTGLAYGCYYSFFESLPLVYPAIYRFSAQSTALIFLCVAPAAILAFGLHCLFLKFRMFKSLSNGTFGEVENYLLPGVLASPTVPIGLFLYAWTARSSIHWIVPTIGLSMSLFGTYFIVQSILLYIPNIYPRYAASIFAANTFSRSALAFAAILFSRPMFEGIGIAGGTITLITGANGGIGFELATQLLANDKNIVLLGSRSLEKGHAALKKLQDLNLPGTVELVNIDVDSESSVSRAAKQVEENIDALVNNAAIFLTDTESPLAPRLTTTFLTNVVGPAIVTASFAPLLSRSKQTPRLVNVSSGGGSITARVDPSHFTYDFPDVPYRTSKAALNMLTACHAYEYGRLGWKVFAFCPGYTASNLSSLTKAELGAQPSEKLLGDEAGTR